MGICEEPASGDTLNRLGASLGYSRAAVESDDDYRVRILVEESVKDFVARNASTWEYIRKLGPPPGLDSEQIPAGLLPGASNQERFRCIERLKAEHRKWAEQYFREAVVVKRVTVQRVHKRVVLQKDVRQMDHLVFCQVARHTQIGPAGHSIKG